MRFAIPLLAAFGLGAAGLATCVGAPSIDKVAAEVEASGACRSLPAGVTCACVISSAHDAIPTIKIDRSDDDTGSRLGRGTVGQGDERLPLAIAAAKQSCAAGKAVG